MTTSPIFVNAHSDYPIQILRNRRGGKENALVAGGYLDKQRTANVAVEVMTVATDGRFSVHGGMIEAGHPRTVLETIDAVHQEIEKAQDSYRLICCSADLNTCLKDRKIGLILNLEGVGCVEDDFSLWRNYYRLGVRALSLTHDPQNRMASGCREPDGGLTRLGRAFVKQLNGYGVILDLVHAGERSFYDALDLYDGPVVVSHSNARALCDVPRNLTDDQIRAVGARGGFVAVNFVGAFLRSDGQHAEIDDVVRHIDHIAGLIGADKVAVGPDFVDYMMDFLPALLAPLGIEADAIRFARGLEALQNVQALAEALMRAGYSSQDTAGIMGQNALRVYDRILG